MQHPLLSLCIPTYSNAPWLEYTLRIALEQARPLGNDIEIVVSDNASTDHTPQVLEQLKQEYGAQLVYQRNTHNIGHNGNYLRCAQLSKGSFIWMVGTDDILFPHALQRVLEVIRQHPDINYIYVPYVAFPLARTPSQTKGLQELLASSGPNLKHPEGLVPNLRELATLDCNSFTPIYCSVVKRTHWINAFGEGVKGAFFETLTTSVPEATYIIEHMLDMPGYCMTRPGVLASLSLSWNEYSTFYTLFRLPELYDLLESHGIEKSKIDAMRKENLAKQANPLLFFLIYPKTARRFHFSFTHYAIKHFRFFEFWVVIMQISGPWLRYFLSKHFWLPRLFKKNYED